jgi:hypothetical protein
MCHGERERGLRRRGRAESRDRRLGLPVPHCGLRTGLWLYELRMNEGPATYRAKSTLTIPSRLEALDSRQAEADDAEELELMMLMASFIALQTSPAPPQAPPSWMLRSPCLGTTAISTQGSPCRHLCGPHICS